MLIFADEHDGKPRQSIRKSPSQSPARTPEPKSASPRTVASPRDVKSSPRSPRGNPDPGGTPHDDVHYDFTGSPDSGAGGDTGGATAGRRNSKEVKRGNSKERLNSKEVQLQRGNSKD